MSVCKVIISPFKESPVMFQNQEAKDESESRSSGIINVTKVDMRRQWYASLDGVDWELNWTWCIGDLGRSAVMSGEPSDVQVKYETELDS